MTCRKSCDQNLWECCQLHYFESHVCVCSDLRVGGGDGYVRAEPGALALRSGGGRLQPVRLQRLRGQLQQLRDPRAVRVAVPRHT